MFFEAKQKGQKHHKKTMKYYMSNIAIRLLCVRNRSKREDFLTQIQQPIRHIKKYKLCFGKSYHGLKTQNYDTLSHNYEIKYRNYEIKCEL